MSVNIKIVLGVHLLQAFTTDTSFAASHKIEYNLNPDQNFIKQIFSFCDTSLQSF